MGTCVDRRVEDGCLPDLCRLPPCLVAGNDRRLHRLTDFVSMPGSAFSFRIILDKPPHLPCASASSFAGKRM